MKTPLILKTLVFFLIISVQLNGQKNKKDHIYSVVEYMPHFEGCEDIEDKTERKKCSDEAIITFLQENVVYPVEAREQGIEGRVVVRFIVEKDGTINGLEILKDPGAGCGEESLRVINLMPNWIPGKQKGKKVRVYFTLPIMFKLSVEELPQEYFEPQEKFSNINDIFCERYLAEFMSKEKLNNLLETEMDTSNVCSVQGTISKISNIKLTYTKSGEDKEYYSNNGVLNEEMLKVLKNVEIGDVIAFEFIMIVSLEGSDQVFEQEVYRSLIIE